MLACIVLTAAAGTGVAQELTPRAYWPAPRGTQLAILGFNYSTGDVLTDPSLPVVGVDSRISLGLAAYLRIFDFFGRTGSVLAEVPYSKGVTEGELEGIAARRDYSGLGDIGFTVAMNFLGAPTLTPQDFQELRSNPRKILGGSLKVVLPTGDYDPTKLINVGTNRWSVKGELGFMFPMRPRWLIEVELGASLFGDNDDFFGGVTREQAPLGTTELHLVKRFRPGFWASLDFTYYYGGRTTVGGVLRADLQRNSRLGGTLVVPYRGRHAFKLGYSTGVVTASGGDFDSLLVSYSRIFR